MNDFSKLRKAVGVFQLYGISLIGNQKKKNLFKDLQMDPVFINGLIFELELALQVEVENEIPLERISPILLIAKFLKNELLAS